VQFFLKVLLRRGLTWVAHLIHCSVVKVNLPSLRYAEAFSQLTQERIR